MAENIGVYEGMFILDSNRFARERDKLAKEVEGLIEAIGGDIEVSRLWEERRLAYPINGQRKGAYWLIYFRAPTGKITELTRACEINDSILRQLFVRLPHQLVEPILAHAKGEPLSEAPVEEGEPVGAGA
ncbi:MAG: 30S ribosomal protein S6 [Pirellulales bacterium]|nr:30S ribosomal protein S6 [Pirellulales bacterium]MBX3434450.1 30S ribosomal protein S6 [Pirellulales bacterium]